jgi:hypothetical protein
VDDVNAVGQGSHIGDAPDGAGGIDPVIDPIHVAAQGDGSVNDCDADAH